MRKTKIVCTLGPATDREGVLRQMLEAGMNVARFNFSHGSHAEHKGRLDALKALRAELGLPVAAMLDTKGPEVRLKSFAAGSVMLRTGQEFTLTTRDIVGDEQGCSITYADLPGDVKAGDTILASAAAHIKPGNCLPLANIPVGTIIHNIELQPGYGAQLVRSAGVAAQLLAKEGELAQVRLPSGEVRYVRMNCTACIGQVGNIDHGNVHIGKAGRKRHMGIRPTVRGSVMNPNDHPHGGGEGRAPVGRPGPVTPWGKPAMGLKTRKAKNPTNKFIIKRRNGK